MPGEALGRLVGRQTELVRALIAGGPVPQGLDAGRVVATMMALRQKRAIAVARAWPVLAAVLGDELIDQFVAYAEHRPPAAFGALGDGLLFACDLARMGDLPAAARGELLAVSARLADRDGHVVRRTGVFVGGYRRGSPAGLVVLVRLPLLGVRELRIRLP